ncbi:solute carrier family 15 member 4-like [Halichondria panicea]|uniref:solute carrier family 15 member 4-like n=1 Tax=Halichondria panicea TaxID=6063 RepID=UPI00312BA270
MRYKPRFFYSKGAFLVLLWLVLQTAAWWSFICLYYPILKSFGNYNALALFGLFLVGAPLAGWLADARYSNYKVFKTGAFVVFLASVLLCMYVLLTSNGQLSKTLQIMLSYLTFITLIIGVVTFIVTALQLGLDQMPDASADNIASFIVWFVFSIFLGMWMTDTVWCMERFCLNGGARGIQVFSLSPVICMSLLCSTMFLLGPKWLTIEPKSPKALTTIFQVLKFAAKHKAPINRSALTYWEEKIPSRLDLGKSRYGGPFTTEQVEDVKTFFKIVIVHLPLFISSISFWHTYFRLNDTSIQLPGFNICPSALIYVFTYHPSLCSLILILVSEFVLYPLVKIQPPSILQQIGILYFVMMFGSVIILAIQVVGFVYDLHLYYGLERACLGCMGLTFSRTFQFVCAQSPYNMRGLLAGYTTFIHMLSIMAGVFVDQVIKLTCTEAYKDVVHTSVAAALSLVGFVLHCLLARWYKRRVRDEDYNAHRVVEEIYDRYISYYH